MPYQVVYSSEATRDLGQAELEALLAQARTGNAAREVTGALVCVDGVFLQVLEGERAVVDALMARIEKDPRHTAVQVFFQAEVPERAFGSWKMACVQPSFEQLRAWSGQPGAATVQEVMREMAARPQQVTQLATALLQAVAP